MTNSIVKFMRVASTLSKKPVVLAVVDGHLVRWTRSQGWTCGCTTEGDECTHVDTVAELLDDRVLGDER